jgi:L-threonylcarbamoyladenylate synthase
VYGLGADALNPEAVDRIFAAKERPSCDPIIVHIAHVEDLCMVARDLPPQAYVLSRYFWPGPVTLILPRAEMLSARVTAGLDTVAVRMPDHPVTMALIWAAETPIAAPSANLFGHVSPTTARHVIDDLGEMDRDGVNQLPVMAGDQLQGVLGRGDVVSLLRTMSRFNRQ